MRRELESDEEREEDVAARASDEDAEVERGEEDRERARARVRFERVAAGMAHILAQNPTLRIEDGVSLREARGLEELYAAARGEEDGQPMSALVRMAKLNEALALLRPALAAGQDPALPEHRRRYAELADQVGELRHRITQRIGVEAVVFGGGKRIEDKDEEDEGDDDGERGAAGQNQETRGRREGEG